MLSNLWISFKHTKPHVVALCYDNCGILFKKFSYLFPVPTEQTLTIFISSEGLKYWNEYNVDQLFTEIIICNWFSHFPESLVFCVSTAICPAYVTPCASFCLCLSCWCMFLIFALPLFAPWVRYYKKYIMWQNPAINSDNLRFVINRFFQFSNDF